MEHTGADSFEQQLSLDRGLAKSHEHVVRARTKSIRQLQNIDSRLEEVCDNYRECEVHLYRMIEESLSNTVMHISNNYLQ